MTQNNYKNKVKSFSASLFNGDFWFGDAYLNRADKNFLSLTDIVKEIKDKEILEKQSVSLEVFSDDYVPQGYIRLILKDIDVNQIFLKHNMTLKYLEIEKEGGKQKYIKSFILGSEGREMDCYSVGENMSLTIEKHNSSILNLKLKEISGREENLSIVNGVIIT